MDSIHLILWYVAVVLVIAGVGWSATLAVTGRSGGASFVRFQAAVVSLLIVAAASGAILIVMGERPADGIHLLYAALAVAIIPLARSFIGRTGTRGATVLLFVGFAVLAALAYRLLTTG